MIKFLRSLNRQFINQIHTIELSQPGEDTNVSWSRFMRYQPVSLLCIVSTRLQSLPRYQFPMSVNRKSFLSINPDRTPLFTDGERKLFACCCPRNFFFSLLVNKKTACSKNRNGSLLHKEKESFTRFPFSRIKKIQSEVGLNFFFILLFSASIVSSPIGFILFGAESKKRVWNCIIKVSFSASLQQKCQAEMLSDSFLVFITNDRSWLRIRANYCSPISELRCMY